MLLFTAVFTAVLIAVGGTTRTRQQRLQLPVHGRQTRPTYRGCVHIMCDDYVIDEPRVKRRTENSFWILTRGDTGSRSDKKLIRTVCRKSISLCATCIIRTAAAQGVFLSTLDGVIRIHVSVCVVIIITCSRVLCLCKKYEY